MSSFPGINPGSVYNPILFGAEEANLDARYARIGTLVYFTGLNVSGNAEVTGTVSAQSLVIGGSPVNLDAVNVSLGTFAASKVMSLNNSGVGLMSVGSPSTNCLRFYGGETNRESVNIYRATDAEGLTIASTNITGSTQKTYPILRLITTTNASNQVAGVSATCNDLLRIDWNDRPTGGFTSQTHRFLFNIGNGQPYKSGFPHTFTLASTADSICLNPGSTSSTPSSGCLYVVSDTQNKLLFNTNVPFTLSPFGSPNVTINGGIAVTSNNTFSDGSTSYDTALMLQSSNPTPVRFAVQLHTGTSSTRTNPAIIGTITDNDVGIMTNNSRRMTVSSTQITFLQDLVMSGATEVTGILNGYTNKADGSNSVCIRFGNNASAINGWNLNVFRSGTNSHFSILNEFDTGGTTGINIGNFSSVNASGGAIMVLNGAGGDGTYRTCGTSTGALGSMHLNCGVSRSVPTARRMAAAGESTYGGGSITVSLYAHQNIWSNQGIYISSDRRLKDVLGPIDADKAKNLLSVEPCWFRYKDNPDGAPVLGVLAQDLIRVGLDELTNVMFNDAVKDTDEECEVPAGHSLVVSYDKIPLYLLELIKQQQAEIDNLKKKD